VRAGALTAVLLALVLAGCGGGGEDDDGRREPAPPAAAPARAPEPRLPAVDARIPGGPDALAALLTETRASAGAAVRRWRREGDPARDGAPRDVARYALLHQRIVRRLARAPGLERRVLRRVARPLAAETRDLAAAPRELGQIVSVRRGPPPRVRTGPSPPADRLRAEYVAAFRRFGVGRPLLAAVNFVESEFGKLRNRSVSGAQGPMQFMPATWAAYGLGGDVRDTRDAIMGAANYLRAGGAPRDERSALFSYNPSDDYVSAVSRYARRFRADPDLFYVLYAWQVHAGGARVTSFGL
jgi:soluble lytic murein transglycosylase-like protein